MAQNGITIQIIGVEEVQQNLKDITIEKLQKADEAVKQAGFYIQGEVQASIAGQRAEPTSVDTGRFLNSVTTTFPAQYTAAVETNVEYAKFLEYGTTRIVPRMHFSNTVIREKAQVKEMIKEAIVG